MADDGKTITLTDANFEGEVLDSDQPVLVTHEKIHVEDCEHFGMGKGKIDRLERVVELLGPLTDEQRRRLLEIADRCPASTGRSTARSTCAHAWRKTRPHRPSSCLAYHPLFPTPMSWIDAIDETSATGRLKEVYDELTERRGKPSNIMRVQSLHPEAMKAHLDLYESILFGASALSRAQCELIGVVVSAANDCAYCVRHHEEALKACWRDAGRAAQVAADYRQAALSEADRALAGFADALTRQPGQMSEEDVAHLRDAGHTDTAILEAALVAGYFNFVNRLALGLGVAFTEEEATGYEYAATRDD